MYTQLNDFLVAVLMTACTLTESSVMGCRWSKFGDDMGEAMAYIYLIYGFNMGCCRTYQTHMEPLIFYFCLYIVCFYGIATYFADFHTFSIACDLGMVWVFPILPFQTEFPVFWEFLGFPRNSWEFSAIQTTHNLRRMEFLGISGI